jgi:alpha-galactosidase
MTPTTIDLSTSMQQLIFQAARDRIALTSYSIGQQSWLHPSSASGLFAVYCDGNRYDATNLLLVETGEEEANEGIRHQTFLFSGPGFSILYHVKTYANSAVTELSTDVRGGEKAVLVDRIDSFSLNVPAAAYELMYYTGDWGSEFEMQQVSLREPVILDSRSGRSSKGKHPWFALSAGEEGILSSSVVWSGNWVFRFEPLDEKGWRVSGGLNDWEFCRHLEPGDVLESPAVVLVLGQNLNAVSQQYTRVGRKHWYPRNKLSSIQPVEWNHWWPYEDVEINEEVFRRNIDCAETMGVEVCTLDAGWFGPSEAGTHWYEYRGDWALVNSTRFPSGIRALSDQTHQQGMKFGLWCEIEGLGINAQLAKDHPEYIATRDEQRLGHVCFGNPSVKEWAYGTLRRLITDYNCDWIKLDFNLDPGHGCNRTDHGHQAGDGLYAHYRGYYHTLERVRKDFPEVVLENCSSGGLRIDLGILRQTYMTFLSDPDWPVHDLQIFWGASTMLAPDVLLHWSFCEWRGTNKPPQQTFNPRDPNLTQKQFDYYTRISMLGLFGYSQKLPDLPDWVRDRLVTHTQIYKDVVRRFVREADLYRLTGQPKRSGDDEGWSAFQYGLPDRSEHLLFVFRLPNSPKEYSVSLQDLEPDRLYQVTGLENEFAQQLSGRDLMSQGITFNDLHEEDSALLRIY